MADTGKIKEMKDREERCERAQKYVNEFGTRQTQKKMKYLEEIQRSLFVA